jgi:hypothetical protein
MRYSALFEVEVLHDFFLNVGRVPFEALDPRDQVTLLERYDVARFLEIAPTPDTIAVLAGHRLVHKVTPLGFVVAAQVDPDAPDTRPAIEPESSFSLAFSLRLRNASFSNYTALPPTSRAFYRFGNDSGNAAEGLLFLTAPVPTFDLTVAYEAGAVRADTSGPTIDLFQAVRDTGPSAVPIAADWSRIPQDTWDASVSYPEGAVVLVGNRLYRARVDDPGNNHANPAHWELLGTLANQYATAQDRIPLRGSLFTIDVSAEGAPELTARVLVPGTGQPAWERHFVGPGGSPLERLEIDLRWLRPGVHRLDVSGPDGAPIDTFTESFYLSPSAVSASWLGVIEIELGAGDLALLDGTGAMRSPRFRIRFLNRPTRWRYVFPASQELGAVTDVVAEDAESRLLVTPDPIPLTAAGPPVRLQGSGPPGPPADEVLLPVPDALLVRREGGQWYSEIHVPNLPL